MAKRLQTAIIFLIFLWPTYYAKIIPDYNTSEKYLVRSGWVLEHQTHAKYVVSIASLRKFSLEDPSTFGQGHSCGGCIIGIRTILTAAHCIYNKHPKDWVVIAGTPVRTKKVETTLIHRVKNMTAHENYDPKKNYINDIGIIHLHGKLIEDYKTVQRIYIAPARYAKPKQICLLVGWGRVHPSFAVLGDILQYVTLKINDKKSCKDWLPKAPEGTFCAFDPMGRKGAGSKGDSGGPLICHERLAGVLSLVYNSNRSYPTHFTNVTKYIGWIRANTIDDIYLYEERSLDAQRWTENVILLKTSIFIIFLVNFL